MVTKFKSPNYNNRNGIVIDTLVIHHTGGLMPGCLDWMCNEKSKVSAHYLIVKDGTVYQLVDDKYSAWHAGLSEFDYNHDGTISQEEKSLNRRSLGIELEFKNDGYTSQQMQSLIALSVDLVIKYKIPVLQVVGHKEIAPGRKVDPADFDMIRFRATIHGDLIDKGLTPEIAGKGIPGIVYQSIDRIKRNTYGIK